MKLYQFLTAFAVCGMAAAKLTEKKAKAWFAETHESVIKYSLELAKKNSAKADKFYKHSDEIIIMGANENDRTAQNSHERYYVCCNAKGKILKGKGGYYKNSAGKLYNTSRTALEQYYTTAVCLYKSGRTAQAFNFLGKACCMLANLGCSPLAGGFKYQEKASNPHHAFIDYANVFIKLTDVSNFGTDKRAEKSFKTADFSAAVSKLCKNAAEDVKDISSCDPETFEYAADKELKFIVPYCVGLLMKFMEDCTEENHNYISDGKTCTIQNELTGLLLSVKNKGQIALTSPEKKTDCHFKAAVTDKGYFEFSHKDEGCVNEKFHAFSDSAGEFSLIAAGKDKYRIVCRQGKFLTAKKDGSFSAAKFDPENKGQIWIIK